MVEPRTETNIAGSALLRMTAKVVSAYVRRNTLPVSKLAEVIGAVHASLSGAGDDTPPVQLEAQKPAVPIKKSITDEYLICLEDGKKLKMLKRHLRSTYSLTPDQYRAKWGLPSDYPMVAPQYAAVRSAFAKKTGLGQASSR